MAEVTCAEFRDVAPELALGRLEGRERAEALAHAAHCVACQHELSTLGDVADELITLTPAVEPPPGFETKVIGSLRRHRRRRLRRGQRIWALAAAAVVAVGVALGGWALSGITGGDTTADYAAHPISAPLMAGGHQVGEVMLTEGRHPWLSMALNSHLGNATVACQVRESNGRVVTVGWFRLANGNGFWAAALPDTPSEVTSAQVSSENGTTIASANL